MFYVYEFRDQNGVPFYIGKGSKKRINQHEARARSGIVSHFYNKLRKIWARGFKHQKAIVFESLFEEHAFAEEIRLIAYYGRENLTNQTDGGDGNSNPSAEVREKMAQCHRGRVTSEATRNRQRLAALARPPVSAETKAKIARKAKGKKRPWARALALRNLAKFPPSKGRKWTEQQRRLFHEARKGHAVSQETRDKISKTKKQRHKETKNEIPIL